MGNEEKQNHNIMAILGIITPEDVAKIDVLSEKQKRTSLTSSMCETLVIDFERISTIISEKEEREEEEEEEKHELSSKPEDQDSKVMEKSIKGDRSQNLEDKNIEDEQDEDQEVFEDGDVRNLLNMKNKKKKKKSEGSIESVHFFLEQKDKSKEATKEIQQKEINSLYKKNLNIETYDVEGDKDDAKKRKDSLKLEDKKTSKKIVDKSGILFNKKQY